jgi:hypothetical protein
LGVRHNAVKASIDVFREVTVNLQLLDLAFEAAGLHEAGELGKVWKMRHSSTGFVRYELVRYSRLIQTKENFRIIQSY